MADIGSRLESGSEELKTFLETASEHPRVCKVLEFDQKSVHQGPATLTLEFPLRPHARVLGLYFSGEKLLEFPPAKV